MGEDLQAIIEEFDLDERERKLLRAVAALLESREGTKRRGDPGWDMTYKGDEVWLEALAILANLVSEVGPVKYGDLDLAPRFREVSNIYDPKQWHRFIDQHLQRPSRRPDDGRDWAVFRLPGSRAPRYVTFRRRLHCDIAQVGKVRKDAKRIIEETRRALHAEDPGACEVCLRPWGATVGEDLQPVVSHDKGLSGEGGPWSPEKREVHEAAMARRSQSGRGSD